MKLWRSVVIKFTLVFMLVSILSPLNVQANTNQFSDIKGHWASNAIAWAIENKIVSGYPDGTFRPNGSVTEPEFLVMLLKAYPNMILPQADKNAKWYEPYYSFAENYNWPLLHELDGKQFNRGSVAHLLAATQGHTLTISNAVQFVMDNGIANGKTSATVAGFGIQDKLRRSEALTLIKNMYDSGLTLKKAEGAISPISTAPISLRGIAIGDSEKDVIDKLGAPARYDLSEYGFDWYIYNQDYTNYAQIGVHAGKVVGLYSNVDNWSTKAGIQIGSNSSAVTKAYGVAITSIRKGNTIFNIDSESQVEAPRYLIGGSYVNFFLDMHNNKTVTSMLVIEENMELSLQDFYGPPSEKLRISFERQVFDLANAVRVRFANKAFVWNDQIANTARKHSKDMADKDYFDHENLDGLSPFDRMNNDGIKYLSAAENIAMGQTSAIFVHESWMNSTTGHRENILSDIERLGVGIYLGGSYQIYYTQNFYTP